MHEQQLRCFIAIADAGSLNKAAAQLDIAQPTLSQMLMRLEEDVAAKLFVRNSRGVALTEAGALFRERAEQLITLMDKARVDLQVRKDAAEPPVRVGLPSVIAHLLGAQYVLAARAFSPDLTVNIMEALSSHIVESIDKGLIDFGVVYDGRVAARLSVRPLVTENLYLVAGPGVIAPGVAAVPAQDIAAFTSTSSPMILPARAHGRTIIDELFERESISVVEYEINSSSQRKALVSQGYGVTILAHAAIRSELAAGTLSAAPIVEPVFDRTICLLRNPQRPITPTSAMAEAVLCQTIQGLISTGDWIARWVGGVAEASAGGALDRSSR